ncbi:MAG TPA: gluconokinase [Flavitalea sp.]|nr:gluconokinase [Flavitalea sp.]
MSLKYYLGIDIGTSNTKALLYTLEGKLVNKASVSYATLPSAEGIHEQQSDILLEAFISALRQVAYKFNSEIKAVCCSSAMHSLMAVDKNHHPLTNLITWADNRSALQSSRFQHTEIGNRLALATGTPIHPMSPLFKLIWLREEQPEIFQTASKFISIKEYIFFNLFREYVIDHSMASSTGLFDIRQKIWDKEALRLAGVEVGQLSQPVPVSHIMTGMDKSYAIKTGLAESTPFIIGATDGCLATIGSHAVNVGDCALTIGTSGAVRMLTKKARHTHPSLFNYILDEEYYVAGGPINNGGIAVKWYAENFLNKKIDSDADLTFFAKDASTIAPGSGGLLFLPYLLGERAPVWDAAARGVIFGINASHNHRHFMRALLEGISFALFQVLQMLEESICPAEKIFCSGGFTSSPEWLQLLSDVMGKEITVSINADASASGAAMVAAKVLDGKLFSAFSIDEERVYSPDEKAHSVYEKIFPVYTGLYDSVKSHFATMNSLHLPETL